jgi:hypothetical protein
VAQDDPEVVKRKRARVQEFIQRNFLKHQQKLMKQKDSEVHRLPDARPQLSQGTLALLADKQRSRDPTVPTTPTFEELYAQAKKIQKRKQDREQAHVKELAARELEGVTFKPKINTNVPVVNAKKAKEAPKEKKGYLAKYYNQ